MPSLIAVGGALPYIHIANAAKRRRLPNPSALPTGIGSGCSFSPDGSLLAVAHSGSPHITIYNTSDWSKAQDIIHAAGDGRSVAFVQSDGLVLRGEVRDIDGYVASRKVRVYERSTGDLVAETTSSAVDGSYEVAVYEGDVAYDVQFMADPLENLNDLFFAKAIAGTP